MDPRFREDDETNASFLRRQESIPESKATAGNF
jgi:hypothetical protein